jgi:hypothetical protein
MRKLISLGLLALLFSVLASPVVADVEDCVSLKGTASKGLYGLCVAYWNAGNDNARDRILDNFEKKAGPDVGMPGLKRQKVTCPCWEDEALLLNAACNHSLTNSVTGEGVEVAQFDFGLILFQANDFFSETGGCIYTNFYDIQFNEFLPTNAEENLTCRAGVNALVAGDLLDLCPE